MKSSNNIKIQREQQNKPAKRKEEKREKYYTKVEEKYDTCINKKENDYTIQRRKKRQAEESEVKPSETNIDPIYLRMRFDGKKNFLI